jgi:hypothetical protein
MRPAPEVPKGTADVARCRRLDLRRVEAGAAVGGDLAPGDPLALVVFVVVSSAAILFAVGYELFGGERARQTLDHMKTWMTDHNHAVMAVLFLVFGVVLIAKGIGLLS